MARFGCWLLAVIALAIAACEPPKAAPATSSGPPAEIVKRAVESLLPGLQFGPDRAQQTMRELRALEIAGAHFVPSTNQWIVHYCAEFTNFASDAAQRRCDMNVRVYQLDSGKWVGFASGTGSLYRWQVIDEPKAHAGAGAKPPADAKRAE